MFIHGEFLSRNTIYKIIYNIYTVALETPLQLCGTIDTNDLNLLCFLKIAFFFFSKLEHLILRTPAIILKNRKIHGNRSENVRESSIKPLDKFRIE